MLRQFHYIDPNGKDQGVNVRNRSAELVKLLSDVDTIRVERKKARQNRNKYGGVEGGAGLGGGFSSGSSRYGGFGSETGGATGSGYGGYQGEVYGDGGGFGGRETDFSGTQRRGDQFEEYDEGDEEETTRPVRSTATRTTPTATAKRDPPRAKEPEPDLFDFGDEPSATTSNGQGPAAVAGGLGGLGAIQTTSTTQDDDDFDDFQSAPSSAAAAQPVANPLAALAAPPTTSTTTSATQFAAPKPLAPGQTASFNNIFATASPAPSNASSLRSPAAATFSPPPAQKAAPPLQPAGSYKPTGPNYFTSVPTTAQSTPTSTASTPMGGVTPSYTSSTSAASLGRPASKTASSAGGGDVFGSLWNTASSKAGVKTTTASQKGPDLASMAKAKSQAGIWGAASAASSTPRPGAVAPTPNTASGQAKPAASLGNGLDDLLG
jgi:epsin